MNKTESRQQNAAFDYYRRAIGLIGGPVCALLVFFTPIADLSPVAHKLLAITVFISLWWITEPVPIPVTSLLGPTLAVVTGVVPVSVAFASFANPMIFLFMGGFMLATAMKIHGLDERFSFGILSMSWVGSHPVRIFLAIGLATAICSGWVSNTATAAMMFPIALGLLKAMEEMFAANGEKIDLMEEKYATGLMLMTGYAASIGGVFTPIGTPPNLIMLSLLDQMAGIQVSFFEWMIWGGLAMVLYFLLTCVILLLMFPAKVKHIEGAELFIQQKVQSMGPWTRAQKNTLFAFLFAVVLWVMPGFLGLVLGEASPLLKLYNQLLPESVVAMLAGLMLFLLPVGTEERSHTLTWKEASAGIEWGTLVLFGGGLAMGSMMYKTGLSAWVGNQIISFMGGEPSLLMMTLVFCVVALLMSELTSHTAATNMIGPLGITAAVSLGVSPVPVAVGIALSSSLGFMLPVSTPPNAIVYSSGYIPITKMIKTGIYIDVIGILVITVPIAVYVVTWLVG